MTLNVVKHKGHLENRFELIATQSYSWSQICSYIGTVVFFHVHECTDKIPPHSFIKKYRPVEAIFLRSASVTNVSQLIKKKPHIVFKRSILGKKSIRP